MTKPQCQIPKGRRVRSIGNDGVSTAKRTQPRKQLAPKAAGAGAGVCLSEPGHRQTAARRAGNSRRNSSRSAPAGGAAAPGSAGTVPGRHRPETGPGNLHSGPGKGSPGSSRRGSGRLAWEGPVRARGSGAGGSGEVLALRSALFQETRALQLSRRGLDPKWPGDRAGKGRTCRRGGGEEKCRSFHPRQLDVLAAVLLRPRGFRARGENEGTAQAVGWHEEALPESSKGVGGIVEQAARPSRTQGVPSERPSHFSVAGEL